MRGYPQHLYPGIILPMCPGHYIATEGKYLIGSDLFFFEKDA